MMQKSHQSTIWLALLVLGLLLTLAACGGTPPATSASGTNTPTAAPTSSAPTANPTPTATPTSVPTSNGNAVTIASFAFGPASLTVKVGTTVTWTNNDSVTHTVTADAGAFASGPLAPGQSFQFTFRKAGTYTYHCSIHPTMTATIIVQ
jgi:plastocyanin